MERKRKKRKRRGYNTQYSSVAKKQHFQIPDQIIGGYDNCADGSFCSGFGLADCSGLSVDHEAALDLTEEMLLPASPKTSGIMGKRGTEKKEAKTKTCFRDLLTQCLCNSSVIVRERRQRGNLLQQQKSYFLKTDSVNQISECFCLHSFYWSFFLTCSFWLLVVIFPLILIFTLAIHALLFSDECFCSVCWISSISVQNGAFQVTCFS